MTLGPARTNISNIAAQAGVSRPTVYAHFEKLEDLISEAISGGISVLLKTLSDYASKFDTPALRITETFIYLLELSDKVDVLRKPMSFEVATSPRDIIPPEAIDASRGLLTEMIGDDLDETDGLAANERAETVVRFFLSLAAFRRQSDVRGYIERVVLPAIGL
jgi:AcrR family transcriptional regulator